MLNMDELFEKKISDLENGVPLDAVLADLPEEGKELADLIRLAAAVRTAPHPEPAADTIPVQRRQVMAAAASNTRPAARIAQSLPTLPHIPWSRLGARTYAYAGAAALLLIVMLALGWNAWTSARAMDTARVESMTGQVQVAERNGAWKNLAPGAQVRQGDTIRTLGASTATLAFFEGTRARLGPNAEIALSELNGAAGGILQVKIDQKYGETRNTVTPFQGKAQSHFLVQTPSGTASVHGTNFTVRVSHTGQAQFSVNTGEVSVQNEGKEVRLLAGQATSASQNGVLEVPTYQFSISGALTDIDDTTNTWTIGDAQVEVADSTVITGDPQLGDLVSVTGRIIDGAYVADSITKTDDSVMTASFTGILEAKNATAWTVGGQQVQVNENTVLGDGLEIGTPVHVTYEVQGDGSWLALEIKALVDQPDEPGPTATATADPTAHPLLAFDPGEIETSSCGAADFQLTGTLRNSAVDGKDYAANVSLGYLIDEGGEYVSAVELNPAGWARIESGQPVTFNIHIAMNDQWTGLNDDEVRLRIYVENPGLKDDPGKYLTISLEAGCKATPTPGATPTITPTALPTHVANPESAQTSQCTGANPHPTGMKLAQRYGVPYEEIMYWFCQHYGFGEIDLAYGLSRQTGKPVAEIFGMRASGMGWGQIKKALQPVKNNGKGKKKIK